MTPVLRRKKPAGPTGSAGSVRDSANSPIRNPRFRALWAAGLLDDTIDWMLVTAIPIFVYRMTESAMTTSLAFLIELAPGVLVGSLAGIAADRYDRRKLLLVCTLLHAALAALLLPVTSGDQLWLVYAVIAGRAVCAQFVLTSKNALLPDLVEPGQRAAASNLVVLNSNLGRLGGSLLGGVVVAGGLRPVAAGSVLGLLLTAGVVSRIRRPERAPVRPGPEAAATESAPGGPMATSASTGSASTDSASTDSASTDSASTGSAAGERAQRAEATAPAAAAGSGRMFRHWREGVAVITDDRRLRVSFLAAILCAIGQGLFVVLFVVFVATTLHGTDAEIGLLRSIQGIGGIAGGLALGFLGTRVHPRPLITWGALSFSALALLIWNAPTVTTAFGVYVVLFAVVGLPGGVYYAGMLGMVQQRVPADHLGRALGSFYTVSNGAQAIGMALAGLLTDRLGPVPLLNAQAVLYLAAGLMALFVLGARNTPETPATATPPAPRRKAPLPDPHG
ncbi:MFS-type transporter involved in bile tolerance (Atg22 family) [Streptomyces sp. BK208]|uniref:MFS transporter n=1 Tax=Streptomyces sp. BK208 TaxID=2512150 RepID=UPI00105BE83A|nr:MFS transporter [Streptomyces sp. BK208]TDT40077.1 MFS-type transporter involved in bile tolerance (Atg22 family) [Streptomyces sp. BK208]